MLDRELKSAIVKNLRQSYKEFGIYHGVAAVFEKEAQLFLKGAPK